MFWLVLNILSTFISIYSIRELILITKKLSELNSGVTVNKKTFYTHALLLILLSFAVAF